ncbi:hypothetical protein SAMN05421505_110121 [Sinosporangium album]|uniref:Uncharacterized protein n=1 Tax=Sinosporangium album TaxID=504805 RepID=A0A1G7YZ09_9ACTN|nr:hypothetical protein [Sinosporangium album]SDH01701.1 hypothetical protein SAMN05421505_110121 [Sinosporangium album]
MNAQARFREEISGFLLAWRGRPDRDIDGPAARAEEYPPHVPWPLREWHFAVSRYSVPVTANHTIYPPDRMYGFEGKFTFCGDDHETVEFAFAADGDDPEVFCCRVDAESESWDPHPDHLTLAGFLTGLLVYEIVNGAAHGLRGRGLDARQCATLLAPLTPLPFPDVYGGRLYSGDGILAIAYQARDGSFAVELAGAAPDGLAPFAQAADLEPGPGPWHNP